MVNFCGTMKKAMLSVCFVVALLHRAVAWTLPKHSLRLRANCAGKAGELDALNLTPKLRKYAAELRNVPDDKLRYQQLLYLASKCPAIDKEHRVEQNKVPGCLSSVYIHACRNGDGMIHYTGDSDSQLTKGLAALLVDGLSGYSPEEILRVDPAFIQYAGIGSSLTPGRNNGLLNMLTMMKYKAKQLSSIQSSDAETPDGEDTLGPLQRSMTEKLQQLQPTALRIVNLSQQHAGHPEVAHSNPTARIKETHFNVHIVAECFASLSRVMRHQMVYALLGDELQSGVHALMITARSPAEEAKVREAAVEPVAGVPVKVADAGA